MLQLVVSAIGHELIGSITQPNWSEQEVATADIGTGNASFMTLVEIAHKCIASQYICCNAILGSAVLDTVLDFLLGKTNN